MLKPSRCLGVDVDLLRSMAETIQPSVRPALNMFENVRQSDKTAS